MTPDERKWLIELHEQLSAVAAAAAGATELVREFAAQLTDLRKRIDALSVITARVVVETKVGPGSLSAAPLQLAHGEFVTTPHESFDYERVLEFWAVWDTVQERIPGSMTYYDWFSEHGRGVSIIIPSYNDTDYLRRCLTCLQRIRESYRSVRIIIADDASPSREHQRFLNRLEDDGVLVIRNSKNMGFAQNINSALELVGAEDFVLLNSDTQSEGYWLEALQYAAYASDSGIVGAKLLYPNRRIQHAGVHRNPNAPKWFDHYYRGRPEFFGPACVPSYQLAITGACLYVANRAFRKLGVLDPGFQMAFEDVDYCLRAWESGEKVLYYPYARVVHHESITRGRVQGARELASQEYFWTKWATKFDPPSITTARRSLEMTNAIPQVIYVLEDTGLAGGHRNIFEHINLLVEAGLGVELWALADAPDWFDLKSRVRTFQNFSHLRDELAPIPCVKVATWWNTAETVWLASRVHGHAAYLVSDIESSYYVEDPFTRARVLASYKHDFRYLTISKWVQEQLAKLGIVATVVSCSVDRSVFKPLGICKRDDVLLAPGRRNHLKNFQFTLKAWASLGAERPQLWMYGGEPDIADFLDCTRYFYKPDDKYLNRLINEATVFVLTSRHEGFALTILEAMSAGTPVITTDCHGTRDFCVHEENCLLVGDGDYAGLIAAIARLMEDQGLRERLTAGGHETATLFSRHNMQRQLLHFFAELVDIPELASSNAA